MRDAIPLRMIGQELIQNNNIIYIFSRKLIISAQQIRSTMLLSNEQVLDANITPSFFIYIFKHIFCTIHVYITSKSHNYFQVIFPKLFLAGISEMATPTPEVRSKILHPPLVVVWSSSLFTRTINVTVDVSDTIYLFDITWKSTMA